MSSESREEMASDFLFGIFMIAVYAGFGLLLAFPIKWCWNFAMVPTFHLPTITWGVAWCLHFLSVLLIKSALINKKN